MEVPFLNVFANQLIKNNVEYTYDNFFKFICDELKYTKYYAIFSELYSFETSDLFPVTTENLFKLCVINEMTYSCTIAFVTRYSLVIGTDYTYKNIDDKTYSFRFSLYPIRKILSIHHPDYFAFEFNVLNHYRAYLETLYVIKRNQYNELKADVTKAGSKLNEYLLFIDNNKSK